MNDLSRRLWALLAILCAGFVAMIAASPLYAHGGGTPRLTNVPVGPYHLYAWSEPEPWRVGEVHLSLAVTKPNPQSNNSQVEIPVTDVDIVVTYTPMLNGSVDPSHAPTVVRAERQQFLSDFYYEADPTLTRVGDWQITVDVSGPDGTGSTDFMMATLPARTLNWALIGGAGVVVVAMLALIAIWSRSQQPAQPAQRPRRGTHRGVRTAPRRSRKASVQEEA
jgi:hypothetical protein